MSHRETSTKVASVEHEYLDAETRRTLGKVGLLSVTAFSVIAIDQLFLSQGTSDGLFVLARLGSYTMIYVALHWWCFKRTQHEH